MLKTAGFITFQEQESSFISNNTDRLERGLKYLYQVLCALTIESLTTTGTFIALIFFWSSSSVSLSVRISDCCVYNRF